MDKLIEKRIHINYDSMAFSGERYLLEGVRKWIHDRGTINGIIFFEENELVGVIIRAHS